MSWGKSRVPESSLDLGRYLKVVLFFARAFAEFIWWELIIRHVPGLRVLAERTALGRGRNVARRYRKLAIEMGGVLIKLGQFLSIRVDVLPPEITGELAGLQDEVPAVDYDVIAQVIADEFGRPLEQVFTWFAPAPEAAASLAQVHKARLPGGEEVVVKVQRPHIERMVETDLAAIRVAANWLKLYRPFTRRADLDRIYEEFARTTRAEMDFVAEGKNAERFAENFAQDSGIYIAEVYWEYTTRRVLTLENVASIKITDLAAMKAAGISLPQVARRLYDAYLEQIFVHNFVHADPHPGNLFVHPMPQEQESALCISALDSENRVRDPQDGPDKPCPFLLIFVDFGMVAVIPPQLRAGLREFLIGVGTRDSHRIVQAYLDAGVLRPEADRRRLEALHDELLRALEGVRMGSLREVAFEQAEMLFRNYRDVFYEVPFQFPSDTLFAMRAVGILSGIATGLDPGFDPWVATIPFAGRIAAEDAALNWRGWLGEAGSLARLVLRLPARLDEFFTYAQHGDLNVQASFAPDASRALRQVERSVDRLSWSVTAIGLLLTGVVLRVGEGPSPLATGFLIGAGVTFAWGLIRR